MCLSSRWREGERNSERSGCQNVDRKRGASCARREENDGACRESRFFYIEELGAKMPKEIYLVKVGMSMTEGMVSEWFIPDGGEVKKGELVYIKVL